MKSLYAPSVLVARFSLSRQRKQLALLLVAAALCLTLTQRFASQYTQLEQTSRLMAQTLVSQLEHSETTLLTLADQLYQPGGPDLLALQRQMNQAMRFSDTIGRIFLIQGNQILLDSDNNELASLLLTSAPANPFGIPGLQISATLPAELPSHLHQQPWFNLTLSPPAISGEPAYQLLLLMDAAPLRQLFELHPNSSAEHYALYNDQGALLLGHQPLPDWATTISNHIHPHTGLHIELQQAPLSSLQTLFIHCERYPITLVRTLDFFCSLSYWGQHNLLAIVLVILSLIVALSPVQAGTARSPLHQPPQDPAID